MKAFIILILTGFYCISSAQNQIHLTPTPVETTMGKQKEYFNISEKTMIVVADKKLEKIALQLNDYLERNVGFTLKISNDLIEKDAIVLDLKPLEKILPEGYILEINKKTIHLTAQSSSGIFYGIQSLKQLIPIKKANTVAIPNLSIKDHPRFAYRGMHLDVSRHFFSVEFLKKYIDYLAENKYNTFHWHLTDDQGWRIEIKKYPKLTEIGGYRNGTIIGRYPGTGNDSIKYGGYYTQSQIKEIVQYATERYVDIIPEIEMPGHSSAAIAAYPELSCFPTEDTKINEGTFWAGSRSGKQVQQTWGVFEDVFCPSEYTFSFLQDVIDEVTTLFPSKYIHIGGDECPKEAWKKSPFCQQMIKDNNLKDEHGLQSYFIGRMEKYINGKGKRIIGWDEILEGGLAPNASVMSWRGEEGGKEAARQNHDVVMTPGAWVYFDHSQSNNEDSVTIGGYTPLDKVYLYEPIPKDLTLEKTKYILGAQANVWTEYIGNQQKIEYMIFPRMIALSEVLWSPKEKRNWEDFEKRLPFIFDRLKTEKINFSKAYYELKQAVTPAKDHEGVMWKLESKTNMPINIHFEREDSNWVYRAPQLIDQGVTKATATSAGISLTQKFNFNIATGKEIFIENEASKSYPGDGAFTLVNGVQNEKGLSRSSEFIGLEGKDLIAVIDLKKKQDINDIVLHVFEQRGSWIYSPSVVTFYTSEEGNDYTILEKKETAVKKSEKGHITIHSGIKTKARFVKIVAKNFGIIPSGMPGSGNPAWLFADEIEVK